MSTYVITTNALAAVPIHGEANSFEEAFKKYFGDYVFKEVDYSDLWDVKILNIDTDVTKYFWVRSG